MTVQTTSLVPEPSARADAMFAEEYQRIARRTDRMFVRLMAVQWAAGMALAITVSPRTWSGVAPSVHVHVLAAIFLGGAITALPAYLASRFPGAPLTRYTIAGAQMLWSGLLIHLSGGRIETHFHIFGSLAFLAAYRDRNVLIPATLVTTADHVLRNFFWPESIFGVADPVWWRAIEHAGWVLFTDVFIAITCTQGINELRELFAKEARTEALEAKARIAIAERVRTEERERVNVRLASARKMEAVGQIAAGIAHEINTPTQYVSDNVVFLERAFVSYGKVIEAAEALVQCDRDAPASLKELAGTMKRSKIDFLSKEIPRALRESQDGLKRVAQIVAAMKEFSHPSDGARVPVDVRQAIKTAMTVARNEWKYVADVELVFPDTIVEIPIVRDEFNQVVLNLVVNAAHAISDSTNGGADGKGTIRIEVTQDEASTVVQVGDSGSGIAPHHLPRIFDPFFTTKEVGKGTGQGLAIAHAVIVERHGGDIAVDSELGVGTTFRIVLPNHEPKSAMPSEEAA